MGQHGSEVGPLVALACALTGQTGQAAELLAATRMSRLRPDPGEDPAGAARARMVRLFLRRQRSSTPAPAPEPGLAPELEAVRRRLDELDPLPRAALVLRHREQLTLDELARITDRPGPAVARALQSATRTVEAVGYELDQVLEAVAAPEPWAIETAARRFTARRRRIRGRWALAAVVMAALVTAGTVLPGALAPDPYARAYGAWVYGFEIRPTTGLRTVNRFLTPGTDTVDLIDEDPGQVVLRRRTCQIEATSGQQRVKVPKGRPTRVGDHPARFLDAGGGRGPALWWSTDGRLSLQVSCADQTSDDELLAVAGMVAPGEFPVRLPVDLSGLPSEEEVLGIYDIDGQLAVLLVPPGQTEESPNSVYVSVGTLFGTADRTAARTVQVGDVTAQVQQDEETDTVCWDLGGPQACVADFSAQDRSAKARERRLARLVSIARHLRLASDTTDRATWFDARDALPG